MNHVANQTQSLLSAGQWWCSDRAAHWCDPRNSPPPMCCDYFNVMINVTLRLVAMIPNSNHSIYCKRFSIGSYCLASLISLPILISGRERSFNGDRNRIYIRAINCTWTLDLFHIMIWFHLWFQVFQQNYIATSNYYLNAYLYIKADQYNKLA